MSFCIQSLSPDTWDAFAALVERHGGVWGGCWCMEFHPDGNLRDAQRRDRKACRVREGTTHAALVFDGARCVGWCQFGTPEELPRIKHQRAYGRFAAARPDWRVTCFFVDKAYRGKGVSSAALAGALDLIATLGGGRVESFPEDVDGRKVPDAFLHNSRLSMFERQGFERIAQLGKHRWWVSRVIAARVG